MLKSITATCLLLIAPLLCGSMLWVCLSEARGQTVATERTETTEKKNQPSSPSVAKTITLNFWTSEEDQQAITAELKTIGYEVISSPSKPGDPMVIIGREYFSCNHHENGLVIVGTFKVKPTCGPNGEIEFETIWKSKLSTLEEAVREWIKAEGGR